jgi:hypothetical protein
MEESTVAGQHMSSDVFADALGWAWEVEHEAWSAGVPKLILLSGGECSSHPQFAHFVHTVLTLGARAIIITNGMWLGDSELRSKILQPGADVIVQVTYDKRFYPGDPPPKIEDKRVVYVEELKHLIPLGRLNDRKTRREIDSGMAIKKYPTSFNLRSTTRALGSFQKAVAALRLRNALGMLNGMPSSNNCIPSVSWDGSVHAGETNNCYKIGDVYSTDEQLTKAVIDMQCNKCGLEHNLNREQKQAIGIQASETRSVAMIPSIADVMVLSAIKRIRGRR